FEIFKYGEYRAADEAIRQATTIFDIGAHAGFFTLYARAINPKAQIVCVEPDENNIEAINQNLKFNNMQSKVKIIPGALVSEQGDYILEISKDSHNHKVVKKDQKIKGRTIVGYKLSDLIAESGVKVVDLLKMDIEGAEVGIIEAWNKSDWSVLRNIVLEYHGGNRPKTKIEKILREHGFSVRLFPSKFDKTMGIVFGRRKG
ncbi:MAG: acyl-CoA oxidase, partial [uncultured bacterium]